MKNFLTIITVFFLTTLTSQADDTNNNPYASLSNVENSGIIINNAFYSNDSNDIIFIDFEDVKLTIDKINLLQNDMTIMEEDVQGLPQDMIHEIDLTLFEKGNYILELVTTNDIIIRKNFTIE